MEVLDKWQWGNKHCSCHMSQCYKWIVTVCFTKTNENKIMESNRASAALRQKASCVSHCDPFSWKHRKAFVCVCMHIAARSGTESVLSQRCCSEGEVLASGGWSQNYMSNNLAAFKGLLVLEHSPAYLQHFPHPSKYPNWVSVQTHHVTSTAT